MTEDLKPTFRVRTPASREDFEFIVEPGDWTIGRGNDNAVVLADSLVSRHHATVQFDGKRVLLHDIGGKNPVRVNGLDIQSSQLLDGDRISIGESELVFEYPPAEKTRTRLLVVPGPPGALDAGLSVDASNPVFARDEHLDETVAAKAYDRLSSLYSLSEKILKASDEEALYDLILQAVTTEISPERGFVGVASEDNDVDGSGVESANLDPSRLSIVRFWDREQGGQASTLEMSETIFSHITRDRKAVLVRDVPDRQDFGMSVIDLKIRSFICAPLTDGEHFLGLVYIDTRRGRHQFDRSDLEFVSAIGRIAGPTIQNLRSRVGLQRENERLRSLVSQAGTIVGSSESMERVFHLVKKVAPRDTSVLIIGENGTGKELIARAIHAQSPRRDRAFVAVNCGAIPPNLVESELFGHEKGAFTGAERTTEGKFHLANGGTLFLDEIGDMPLDMQVKILRAIQERKFYRVGGKEEVAVDIRVLSATHRDLKRAIEEGAFREDLYFRLAVVTIEVPPLRDRGDDILEIAQHFLNGGSENQSADAIAITKAARECLLNHSWPGNIRELRNALEQSVILGDGKRITPADLPPEIGKKGRGKLVFRLKPISEVERQYILRVLDETEGNKARAAQILGISRETLYQKLKQYQANP